MRATTPSNTQALTGCQPVTANNPHPEKTCVAKKTSTIIRQETGPLSTSLLEKLKDPSAQANPTLEPASPIAALSASKNTASNNRQFTQQQIHWLAAEAKNWKRDGFLSEPDALFRLTVAAAGRLNLAGDKTQDDPDYGLALLMQNASGQEEFKHAGTIIAGARKDRLSYDRGGLPYNTSDPLFEDNNGWTSAALDSLAIADKKYDLGERTMGMVAVAAGAWMTINSLGTGSIPGGMLATYGVDLMVTASHQAASGKPVATHVNQALQGLGLSGDQAILTEMMLDLTMSGLIGATGRMHAMGNSAKLQQIKMAEASTSNTSAMGNSVKPQQIKMAEASTSNTSAMGNSAKLQQIKMAEASTSNTSAIGSQIIPGASLDPYDEGFYGPLKWREFYRGDGGVGDIKLQSKMTQALGSEYTKKFLSRLSPEDLEKFMAKHAHNSNGSPFISTTTNVEVALKFACCNGDGQVTRLRVEWLEALAMEKKGHIIPNKHNPYTHEEEVLFIDEIPDKYRAPPGRSR